MKCVIRTISNKIKDLETSLEFLKLDSVFFNTYIPFFKITFKFIKYGFIVIEQIDDCKSKRIRLPRRDSKAS